MDFRPRDPGVPGSGKAVASSFRALSALLPAFGGWVLLPVSAFAHPGHAPFPAEVLTSWNWDPATLLGIGLSGGIYMFGLRRLWRRAGAGRGIATWRVYCFFAGLLAVAAALISPIDAFGKALFSAHMVQHELLMLVGAPLMVLGAPWLAFLWAVPSRWRPLIGTMGRVRVVRRSASVLASPVAAWVVFASILWIWHIPLFYQATLANDFIHHVQHLSFFGASFLFWWILLHPGRSRRSGYGTGVVYVFTTALHGTILSALLTFARSGWYPVYEERAAAWSLTLLEDQQLAGLIMWVPPGFIYLSAAVTVLALWLRQIEWRAERREGQGDDFLKIQDSGFGMQGEWVGSGAAPPDRSER